MLFILRLFPLGADFILFRVRMANADIGSTIGVAIARRVINKFPKFTPKREFCSSRESEGLGRLIFQGI